MIIIFYYICKDIEKFKKNRIITNSGFVNEFHEMLLKVENQMVCMHGTKVQRVLEFVKNPISVEMTIKKLLNDNKSNGTGSVKQNGNVLGKASEITAVRNNVLNALDTLVNTHLISLEDYLYIKTVILVNMSYSFTFNSRVQEGKFSCHKMKP